MPAPDPELQDAVNRDMASKVHRLSLEDRIRVTKWLNLKADLDAKRYIIIQLPEWIAAARRTSNRTKRMVIGCTLIGFALGGFAFTAIYINALT